MKTKINKIIVFLYIMLLIFQLAMPSVMAVDIGQEYYLERGAKAFYTIQKINDEGNWIYITYEIVSYIDENGNKQIAYCVDPELPGVGWAIDSIEGYSVKLTENIQNVGLGVNIDPSTQIGLYVWRACINGYPYKTPSSLGVEDEEDAYLATKQAINCILRGYTLEDVITYYRPGEWEIEGQPLEEIQRRGEKVINAMYNLVKIAYTSNQTPENNSIKINKIGEFKEDLQEGFYMQEYSVTSSINIENYEITKLDNFPEDTIITDLAGNEKDVFSKNEHFKVLIPESKLENNILGEIEIKAESETSPIFYGLSDFEGYQNYAVCCNPYTNLYAIEKLNIDTNIGEINVTKLDLDTNESIENVTFRLSKNGKIIEEAKTDEEGIVSFTNLFPGKYVLKEIETDTNYILNEKEITVNLSYSEIKEVEITNEKKKGKIEVIKVDKDNNNIKIPGVVFEILDEDENVVDTLITDENGKALSINLPIDKKYTVREKETSKEYIITEETKVVTLEENQIKSITFENEKKKEPVKEEPKAELKKLPKTGF